MNVFLSMPKELLLNEPLKYERRYDLSHKFFFLIKVIFRDIWGSVTTGDVAILTETEGEKMQL